MYGDRSGFIIGFLAAIGPLNSRLPFDEALATPRQGFFFD
jgi:hypothetical protein